MAEVRESYLEKRCRGLVMEKGGKFIKQTAYKGLPDRLVILPGGVIFFVEFKTLVGRVSKLQQKELEEINLLGIPAYVVRTESHFKNLIGATI